MKISAFLSENFQFLVVKFSIYLNRRVFVMILIYSSHNSRFFSVYLYIYKADVSRPRWLLWMRRPTGDQEFAGSTPAEVGNILSWRLIMNYFLRSFSPFR